MWAARIHVDRVNFSFEGGSDTLPLSPETDWVEVIPWTFPLPQGMTAFTAAVCSPVWTSGDDLLCTI